MSIYTKTGDKGETGLLGGERVSKSSARIEALGTIDEANAALGRVGATLGNNNELWPWIIKTQEWLMVCSANIADPTKTDEPRMALPGTEAVKEYENNIDQLTKRMPKLSSFILPGGRPAAAEMHIARAIVRRAERAIITLEESGEYVNPDILVFINRLSDWLFTAARFANFKTGVVEEIWKSNKL